MGTKTLPDTINQRIRKALAVGREYQSTNPCELVLLVGERGIADVYTLAEFYVFNDYQAIRWQQLVTSYDDPKWGKFHGIVSDIKVYQPATFNPDLIELRDVAGQFSYTIDLSEGDPLADERKLLKNMEEYDESMNEMLDTLIEAFPKPVSGTVIDLNTRTVTAGERIPEGSPIYIGDDGLAYVMKDDEKIVIEGKATKGDN